jgi:Spx/MgsR family transcriptional regulator
MSLKIYEYKNCSTCQKALKYLDGKGIAYQRLAIVETPPSRAELNKMLGFVKEKGGSFQKLFNSSGIQYRELAIAEKIKAGMSEDEAVQLLAANGKLIKRPFLLGKNFGAVGFNADLWDQLGLV